MGKTAVCLKKNQNLKAYPKLSFPLSCIVGTKSLQYLHEKPSVCSSPPASSPSAADGRKLSDLGEFRGMQTPSWWGTDFPSHKIISFLPRNN